MAKLRPDHDAGGTTKDLLLESKVEVGGDCSLAGLKITTNTDALSFCSSGGTTA